MHPVGGGDLEHQVAGDLDAEFAQQQLGLLVVGQGGVVGPGQHDEPVALVRGEAADRPAQSAQVLEGGVDLVSHARSGRGEEEVAGHDDDGRVVDVAQQGDELGQGPAARGGARGEAEVADHVDVVSVGDR